MTNTLNGLNRALSALLLRRFQTISKIASVFAILVGGVVLLGWAFNIAWLKSVLPGSATMKANTALAFILVGASLWNLLPPAGSRRRWAGPLGYACAVLIVLIGALSLAEYGLNRDFGIDQILFKTPLDPDSTVLPGRMGPNTAFNFLMLGLALLTLDVTIRRYPLTQLITLVTLPVALLALTGYLYQVEYFLAGFGRLTEMALHTATTFLVVGLGLLCARPEYGPVSLLGNDTVGGAIARRLLPVAVVLLVIGGWLRLQGERLGLYPTAFGTSLLITLSITLLGIVIWWVVEPLNRADLERRQAEAARQTAFDELAHANRALRTLSDCNQVLVRAESEIDLLNQICHSIVETGGYRMAWVGYAEQDEARTVRPMAHAGFMGTDQNFLDLINISWADTEHGRTPMGIAIRTGQPYLARIATEAVDEVWRTQALQRGDVICMAFPLIAEGQAFGGLSLLASEPGRFDAAEVKLLTELADDLAYGLGAFRTRAARQQAEEALRESLERYHRTLDNMHEGCQMLDFNWRYLYVNEAVARQGRRTRAELLGQTMMAVYPGIEETDMFASLRRCMTERITHHMVNAFTYPDGALGWFELSIQPVPEGIFILSVDITERKRAEAQLRDSQAQMAGVIGSAMDAIITVDAEQRITLFNTAAEKMFNLSSAEARGQMLDRFIPTRYREIHREHIRRFGDTHLTMRQMGAQNALTALRADGTEFPIEASISQTEIGGNKLFTVILRDITERKRAEAALRQSEEFYRRLFANMRETLVIQEVLVDETGQPTDLRFVDINPAAERVLGKTRTELVGQTRIEVSGRPDPEGTQMAGRVASTGQPVQMIRYSPGFGGWFESFTYSLGSNTVATLALDITERRQAEEALRLREQHNLALLQLGKELEQAHRPAEALGAALNQIKAILGYQVVWAYLMADDNITMSLITVQGDIAGRVINEFPSLTVKGDPYLEEVIAANDVVMVEDARTDPRTNKEIVAQLGNRTLLNAPMVLLDKKIGALGTGSFGEEGVRVPTRAQLDFFSALTSHVAVTLDRIQLLNNLQTAQANLRQFNADLERRVAERTAQLAVANADLKAAKDEAVRANQAKSEFLSRMSHELRTPLNAILGFAQILGMEALNPGHQEGLKHILASGRHLLTLINEVLDIARIETGRMSLSPEPVLVSEVVREALDLIQPLAAQQNIQLQLAEIPDQYVRADHQRFKQVLLNLLSNAVKYNHPGGQVMVTSTALPEEAQPGEVLRLEITDTGPGIPAHKVGRLFTAFDRLDADETSVPGTGLGLALSKNLVEAMGGVIGAKSVAGQGSTFWVDMPVVEAPKERLKRTGNLLSISASPLTKAKTVLYIEDNLSNQQLVEQILAYRPTLRLITTMQGRLSVDLAREHQPALILLDLNLPDLHGSQVLDILQADARTRAIPVVVISADATPNQIERLLAAGAKTYLTKPFDVKKFLQVIDELLA